MKLYGIKNCNSVKKAMDALTQKGIVFDFMDIKKINQDILYTWLKQKSFEELINTAGLTSKKLGLNKEKVKNLKNEKKKKPRTEAPASYTPLRPHKTGQGVGCRFLLAKKKSPQLY